MLARTSAALLIVTFGAGAGCDWRPFERLRDNAPVKVLAAPSTLASATFGLGLAQIRPPFTGSQAELVVLADGQPGFATFRFDARGGSAANTQTAQLAGLDSGAGYLSIAPIPGSRQFLTAVDGTVDGAPSELVAVDPETFSTSTPVKVARPVQSTTATANFGATLVAADLDGGGTPDWAATSVDTLTVFFDPTPSTAASATPVQCALPAVANATVHHGMAAADVDGVPGAELAVGVPGDAAGPAVWILHASDLKAKSPCGGALEKVAPPAGMADTTFGAAVAFGHVRSAAAYDLIVGEPGKNAVFVYYNDGKGGFSATPDETLAPAAASNVQDLWFGGAVEAMPLETAGAAAAGDAGLDMRRAGNECGCLAVEPRIEARSADAGPAREAMPRDAPVKVDAAAVDAKAPDGAVAIDARVPAKEAGALDGGGRPDAAPPAVDAGAMPPTWLDDIVVGDSQATVQGVQGAGAVYVFHGGKQAALLYDRNAKVGDLMGVSLGRIDFLPPAPTPGVAPAAVPVLVAGGAHAAYVFFRTGLPNQNDPRQ